MSTKQLTLTQKFILNRGLNFCLSLVNKNKLIPKIKTEINQFIRNLQIKFMFKDEKHTKEPFTGNPKWKPPLFKCNPALSALKDITIEDFLNLIKENKIKHNISKKERSALFELRKMKDIIIKNSDKGGCIVVMNTDDYLFKINSMLNDISTYTPLNDINIVYALKEVERVLTCLKNNNLISKRQYRHLKMCPEPRIPIFYGLPKIHKKDCPLRPIVSQIDSPSYKLNKYLNYLLTTAEKEIPFLLQDTTKFLQNINNLPQFENNSPILFTIDVTSLYTVLPHDMCIEYVSEFYLETMYQWDKYTPDIKPVPVSYLKELITVILNQTFFKFNNKAYSQNYGITMGAPSSVKIANITLYKHLIKIQENYLGPMPLHCFRLIDDIMGIFQGSENSLLNWFNHLNASHKTIQFTIEHSRNQIPFLDTLVYIENNKIKTTLYKKPTNKKQYLSYNSEHPNHMKNSIPYAQILRYRRIIEDDRLLFSELSVLKNNFLYRGYPEYLIDEKIQKIQNLDRGLTIQYRKKDSSNTSCNFTPMVLTFSNIYNNNGKNTVYKLLAFIWEELTRMVPVLNTLPPPKIVFKKCQTIGSLVQSSVFPPKWWSELNGPTINNHIPVSAPATILNLCPTHTSSPCKTSQCKCCLSIENSTFFRSENYNKNFPILNNCNCGSKNVVYLITCIRCNIQYVGETGLCLRTRLRQHRYDIKTNNLTTIGIHFNTR